MIESYPGKANLVTKAVESSNAQFRVANVVKLGKPKSISCQYRKMEREKDHWGKWNLPLTSSSVSVDDGLGRLNSAKARSKVV